MEFVRCVSRKEDRTKISLFYSTQQCRYIRVKTLKCLSEAHLKYFQELLNQNLNLQIDQRFKLTNLNNIQPNYEKNTIKIQSNYIQNRSLFQTVKELALSYVKMKEKQIIQLTFDLLDKLIDNGNRPFFPTPQNIFVAPSQIQINRISFVGLSFTELGVKQICRQQFLEISTLLSSNTLHKHSYVMVKQRAALLFILSLVFNKEMSFLRPKEMGQKLTLSEVQSFLQVQRGRMKKYFQNKSINENIGLFQSKTKLKLSRLVKLLLISEQEMSWPAFIEELTQPINSQTLLSYNLHTLAQNYWHGRTQFQKRKLMKDGIISLQSISQGYDQRDTTLLLIKLTKTPLITLSKYKSFESILLDLSEFDMKNYHIWTNFVKILLENQPKAHRHTLNGRNTLQAQHYQTEENLQSNSGGSILTEKKQINLHFLIELTQKKLSKSVSVGSKKVTFNHEKNSALNQYKSVFR